MRKDTRLTFRVYSDLKKALETIAAREGRSVSQICELLLRKGAEAYKRKGPKYLQRMLAHYKKESSQ